MTTCKNCGKEILSNLILNCTCGKEFCSGRCLRLWHNKKDNSPHDTKLGNSVSEDTEDTPDNRTKHAGTNTPQTKPRFSDKLDITTKVGSSPGYDGDKTGESLSGDWWVEREKRFKKNISLASKYYRQELRICRYRHEKEMAELKSYYELNADNLIKELMVKLEKFTKKEQGK